MTRLNESEQQGPQGGFVSRDVFSLHDLGALRHTPEEAEDPPLFGPDLHPEQPAVPVVGADVFPTLHIERGETLLGLSPSVEHQERAERVDDDRRSDQGDSSRTVEALEVLTRSP